LVLPPLYPDLRPEFPGGAAVAERFPNLTGQPGPGVNGPSLRDIRVALDMADSVSFSPEAGQEQGLVELDEILILDAPAVPE
jgi:hypothetical protein